VVNSEAARRRLVDGEGVPARKVVVIRNGLDVGAWSNVTDIGDAEPIVGMVAHFRSEKDHATFLRAAERIRAVMPSVRFCLVGGGPLESSIRTYAANLGLHAAVTFAGPLTGDALRATVKQFAVSVLTSRHESLSNAVLESMMAGVPVVATAVGGTVELVDDGVSGFLVRPGAADAIAERVLILLKDPMAARAMGARGRAKVEQTFTIGRMVADFQALYRELLESRR
jgi:glycosyltransferase involved in cell wall biosynthesis